MPDPRRVRVEGDLFHGRVPDGAVYVGRAAPGLPRSPYANPFRGPGAVERYRLKLLAEPALAAEAALELAGRDLACWCPLDQPCHADELLGVVIALNEEHREDPA